MLWRVNGSCIDGSSVAFDVIDGILSATDGHGVTSIALLMRAPKHQELSGATIGFDLL